MEWVKTTAKTLPEAIDLALDNLGVDESEAEIVVLEEPRQGLFGRMRGTARVEARVKPKPAAPKNDRNRNRRNRAEGKGKGNDRNRRGGQGGRNSGGGRDRGGRDGGGRDGSNRGGGNRNRSGDQTSAGVAAGGDAGKAEGRKDAGRSGGRGDKQSAGGGGRNNRRSGGGGAAGKKTETKPREPKEEAPVEEVEAHLKTFLTDLSEAFGFDEGVTIESSEDGLMGRIEGRHGLLVGPKGRTLDAIQELARISCQRAVPSNIRIKVDVGGYRQERVEALASFAAQAADRAVADGSEVSLDPMSPADRKTIHDALSDDDRVETRSVGSEPRRKVLVVPVVSDDVDADTEDSAGDDEGSDVEVDVH